MSVFVTLVLAALLAGSESARFLDVLHSWKTLDYSFPNPAARKAMIQQGFYVPGAALPIDVDVFEDRVFVTIPRLAPGIPATLTTVSKVGDPLSPTLDPYPDWSWHRQGQCNGITSVFRVQVDECGRIWVLDTGSVDIFAGIKHICPKQLLIFSLANNKLITRHRFAQSVIKPDSILVTIAVDVRDPDQKCRSTFAYIADVTTYGLIVYDARQERSWRITANNFYPIPSFGHFDILGSEFDLMDGILGLALSPQSQNPRILYYHSLASNTENLVSTAVLRNESLFPNNTNTAKKEFYTYPLMRSGQAAAQAMTSRGVLFFSELTKASLNCWNSNKGEYGGNNLVEVDKDFEHFQFASGMKVVRGSDGFEEVWVLTDRLQRSAAGTLDKNDVNFRILKAPVHSLVAGTKCDVQSTNPFDENVLGNNKRPGGGYVPSFPHSHPHPHPHHPFPHHPGRLTSTVKASVDNNGPIVFKPGFTPKSSFADPPHFDYYNNDDYYY